MLYNQTFNLDQVAFASEGIKDAQQTVCPNIIHLFLSSVHFRKLTISSPYGICNNTGKIASHICAITPKGPVNLKIP
jgi:hypothetical protein